jgi:hypothetical protein
VKKSADNVNFLKEHVKTLSRNMCGKNLAVVLSHYGSSFLIRFLILCVVHLSGVTVALSWME